MRITPYFTKFRISYQSHLYEVDMKFSLGILFRISIYFLLSRNSKCGAKVVRENKDDEYCLN
jgi:hypothetical protein